MTLSIDVNGSAREVSLTRKRMKTIRLHITPDGELKLSAPLHTSDAQIGAFLRAQSGWIASHLAQVDARLSHMRRGVYTGERLSILGEECELRVLTASRGAVVRAGNAVLVCAPDTANQDKLEALLEGWWREQARAYYAALLDGFQYALDDLNVSRPEIAVRKMKSLWGSCNRARRVVTLNMYMYKAPRACCEYIMLHELIHFVQPDHSREFYAIVARYMPDWKYRSKLLDTYHVTGI